MEAEQIAHLLNQHNKLQSPYTGDKILNSKAKYHPITYEGLVFGSVATWRVSFMLTEIKHLVVHKSFRKIGLGSALIARVSDTIDTPIIYATIRSNNEASLKLFQDAGFAIVSTAVMKDHETHFLIKNNEAHLKISNRIKESAPKHSFSSFAAGNGH